MSGSWGRQQRRLLGVMVFALLVLGSGLGLRGPWPPDEPRFALVAREMVDSGQWGFPRVAGQLYPDKPPFFFWVVASLYAVTGSLSVALLLPALLAALGTVLLAADLARRLWGAEAGVAAGAALAVTAQLIVHGRAGQIDGLLLGLSTLSLYGVLRHLLCGPAWGWWRLGWAVAGLGVLTKGVGFLPLLVLLPWFALGARRRTPGSCNPLAGHPTQWWSGPAVFCAVICAWLVPMSVAVSTSGDPALVAYREEILFRQTVVRYADAWHHLHPPWYYLVEVIPVLWLPVVLVVPWVIPRWRQAWRERDLRVLLPLGWMVLILVFFSASPGKRGVYILPALPAFVWAVAPWIVEITKRDGFQRLLRALLGLVAVVGLGALGWLGQVAPARVEEVIGLVGLDPRPLLLGVAVLFGVAALAAGRARAVPAWAAAMLVGWMAWGWLVMPRLDDARSAAALMRAVEARVPPSGELALVGWKEQFILQATRPVVHFGYRRADGAGELAEALAWASRSSSRRVLVPDGHPGLDPLTLSRAERVGSRHRADWWLIAPGSPAAGELTASSRE